MVIVRRVVTPDETATYIFETRKQRDGTVIVGRDVSPHYICSRRVLRTFNGKIREQQLHTVTRERVARRGSLSRDRNGCESRDVLIAVVYPLIRMTGRF